MMDRQPLVSVSVITYNSSKYVIETLDSIKNQTYQNIELVVSDDCSTDNTVELCRNWIEENKERFVRTELLIVEKNTGISANCNRAEAACRGEWVKGIAGDDLLLPECVKVNVDYVNENTNVEFLFSRIRAFGKNQEVVDGYNNSEIFDYSIFKQSTQEQWKSFVLSDSHIPAPTLFYKKRAVKKYNVTNDERIPFIEDEPKWINLLAAGAHLDFIDVVTVLYRVGHCEALSSNGIAYSPQRVDSACRFHMYYKFPERYKNNPDKSIDELCQLVVWLYEKAYYQDTCNVRKSLSYKIGNIIMAPIHFVRRALNKR